MTPREAYNLINRRNKYRTLVECVDLGDRYGFVFVAWDKEKDGELTRDKAYDTFFITGWSTVNKETKKIGELNAAQYFSENPERTDELVYIPVSDI